MVDTRWLPRADLDRLIQLVRGDGYTVIGPLVRGASIVHDEIRSAADLPLGVTDEQGPGRYRLGGGTAVATEAPVAPSAGRSFDFASAPTSLKRFTFPPRVTLGQARRTGNAVEFLEPDREVAPVCFFGARACDIAALQIQDRVLADGPFEDEDYVARRAQNLVIGVECAVPSGTCFCASMGTGPEISSGFDLAMTELAHGFVVRAGTEAGRSIVDRMELPLASAEHREQAIEVVATAHAWMGNPVRTEGLPQRLVRQYDNPRWAKIAERCLACTNCTLVCPTCFCTSVTQTSDLLGTESESWRQWDSCFPAGFASVAGGGNFRSRIEDRYRQWLTHKFGTWVQQFGTSGCVGCGRCITWCPVGIDVREELMTIVPPEPVVPKARDHVVHPTAAAPGRYAIASVREIRNESADTATVILTDLPKVVTNGAPGQFLMLDLPGFSAVPISVSRYLPDAVELTIRAAGPATKELVALTVGSQLGVRGPLGRGWPVEASRGRDLLIVAGGIGLAPLRGMIDAVLEERDRYGQVSIFIGARTPGDLLFAPDVAAWQERPDIDTGVTVDRGDDAWTGPIGVVTQLFDRARINGPRASAFVCGPEKMMQATARTLAARGLVGEQIYLSMERRMECGIGLCGHCQLGARFICRDGPVLSRAELGETFEVEGI